MATGPANQSVLLRDGERTADGWVEAVSSRADDGGLVLRFTEHGEYYLLAFGDQSAPLPRGERNLALYHRTAGEYHEMWGTGVTWVRGTRHTIRFEAQGRWLRVYFDGDKVGEIYASPRAHDPAPSERFGGLGVRTDAGDSTWVVRISSLRWGRFLPPDSSARR